MIARPSILHLVWTGNKIYNIYGFVFFHFRVKYKRCQISEDQRRGNPHRTCSESPYKQANQSIGCYAFFDSFPEYISKSRNRHTGSGTCAFLKFVIDAKESKNGSGTYKEHHHTPRHHFCSIQKNLYQCTHQTSDPECIYIIHNLPLFCHWFKNAPRRLHAQSREHSYLHCNSL